MMKIKLTTNPSYFEFSAFEGFCTLPLIMEDKMIIGNFLINLDFNDRNIEEIPEELRIIFDTEKSKSFYLKKSILTVTKLTAYDISTEISGEKSINASKRFSNFDKEKRIFEFTPTCTFPYGSMTIYFQTVGDIYIEFDLEDIIFIEENFDVFYELQNKEIEEIKKINELYENNFLEKIYSKQW